LHQIWYNQMMSDALTLYLHVPFCRRRCRYCSFVSYERREADIPAYVRALEAELARRARGERLCSIYFGGGTPNLLSVEQVADILAAAGSLFTVEAGAEITIEANPGMVSGAYLAAVRGLGVNRLSLGVQSLHDAELALLGRIHNAAEAREAVRRARRSGFDNLNIDLIYGLPGQSLGHWRQSLEAALELAPEHLSLYALTLEEATPLGKAVKEGSLPAPDPDLSSDQYELAEDLLAACRYGHYEISNWAREGRECRHNLVYWRNLPYLGAGVAAHSYRDGRRRANTESLDRYLAAFAGAAAPVLCLDEAISPELELAETVILGLRLGEGVSAGGIRERLGADIMTLYRRQVAEMTGCGLLEQADGRIRLTRRGRLLSNEVFWRFLPG